MKIHIQFLVLLLTTLASCRKEPDRTPIPLPQEMKDWMYFKKGSYWIYLNVLTDKEDSVWVDTSFVTRQCLELGRKGSYEVDCTDKMYVYQKSTFNTGKHMYESFRGAFVDLRFDYPFRGKYSSVFSLINSSNPYAADSVYAKYQLVGQNFNNVLGYRLKTNDNTSHWLAKNIGVIRWRGYINWYGCSSQTPCDLQLVRYKIVQ